MSTNQSSISGALSRTIYRMQEQFELQGYLLSKHPVMVLLQTVVCIYRKQTHMHPHMHACMRIHTDVLIQNPCQPQAGWVMVLLVHIP